MIKENQRLFNKLNKIIDVIILYLSFYIAALLRIFIAFIADETIITSNILNVKISLIFLLYSILVVFLYAVSNLYKPLRLSHIVNQISKVIIINLLSVLALMSAFYIFRLKAYSRLTLGIFFVVSTLLIIIKLFASIKILRLIRKKGYNLKHTVVVGNGELAESYIQTVFANPHCGIKVNGYIGKESKRNLGKCLGRYENICEILENKYVDEIIIALESHEVTFMQDIIKASEKNGIKISIIPFYNNFLPNNPSIDVLGNIKLLNMRTTPFDNFANLALKRAEDIVLSLILIIVFLPVMLLTAIIIRFTDKGPILFKQERVGLNKKNFTMYKFRSMKINNESSTAWSTNVDPRKTKFGSFIRKTSIDELPQLFNVLKGDMSIIGPRPEIPFFVDKFKETVPLYMLKHQVRPGITGWAQVNGFRGDTSIEGRIECDIWYIENWSIFLDIKIIFMTIFGGMINNEKWTSKKEKQDTAV